MRYSVQTVKKVEKREAYKVEDLISELEQIERIAKQNKWTAQEEENAKTRLINDWKDSEHERHHHMHLHLKKPS